MSEVEEAVVGLARLSEVWVQSFEARVVLEERWIAAMVEAEVLPKRGEEVLKLVPVVQMKEAEDFDARLMVCGKQEV